MADATVSLELDIFDRTFPISCTPDFKENLETAAGRLDRDLRADIGEAQVSTRDLLNHVVALTLEYLCEDADDQLQQERDDLAARIETSVKRLQDCQESLRET